MTAPVAPTTDISAVMEEAVNAVLPAPTDAQPEVEVPAEVEQPADAPEEQAADEADSAGDGDAITLPEGYVAVPAVTEGLATEFRLLDDEGEVEVPALVVEYKANGKIRKDRLDQVVKLAQFGVYNQERESKAQQIEQQANALYQEREEYATLLAQREQQIERLLTDEEFLLAVREAYDAENAPEKQVARAQQQVEQVKVQYEMEKIAESATQFVEGQVQPALDMIARALPSVSADELAERMQYAMQAHVVRAPNGMPYVPQEAYDAVRRYIVEDLAIWAQIQHDRRTQSAAPQTRQGQQAAVDEMERSRIEAQKAKRAIGQTLRPVGRAASPRSGPVKTSKPATIDDAVDSALDAVLSSLR